MPIVTSIESAVLGQPNENDRYIHFDKNTALFMPSQKSMTQDGALVALCFGGRPETDSTPRYFILLEDLKGVRLSTFHYTYLARGIEARKTVMGGLKLRFEGNTEGFKVRPWNNVLLHYLTGRL